MSIQWSCIYCGTVNRENDRFCPGCSSRFPDWQQRFVSQAAGLGGIRKPEFAETPSQDTPFVIPRPGEMIGGLFNFTGEVLAGRVSQDLFSSRLGEVSELIRSAFGTMYDELAEMPEERRGYGESISTLLEFVHYMLNVGIQEMALYQEDGDSSHLIFGRMLAQRAELEYIQILEKLAADAVTNPFKGELNIVGRLASDVIEGLMDIEEFHPRLKECEEKISSDIEEARSLVSLGFGAAGRYDGTNDEVLFKGLSEFRRAESRLAQALVNLHGPARQS